ncbi:hypothetical protein GCM10009416_12120 [Craurococcus roseus]|uniref:Uncharacterized protein n=1 Tax=Craurococcus roseus TaxID=77585 RepID=A0ABP3PTP2_9PROT
MLCDRVADDDRVCVVEAFIDGSDLGASGSEGAGRPAYRPAILLKIHPLRPPGPRRVGPAAGAREAQPRLPEDGRPFHRRCAASDIPAPTASHPAEMRNAAPGHGAARNIR